MKTSSLRKAIIMEINLISAQNLMSSTSRPSSKPMQTYVVAYIDPMEKAVSRVDRTGNRNPTWNDKFVFSVDEEFERRRPYSCLVLEIYRVRRFRKDKKIGVVHVLLEDLLKINGKNCMAFLVRNPSGEPRGIINLGAATLNGMFHEDLPKFLSSKVAIDHRKLMGRG
ncbi:hypothetical protein OIU76_025713 [Salix suchowensis]|nr:hypothetical protein OIU76_025713 [Salix suchowensis]